jgi:hypothetical protein
MMWKCELTSRKLNRSCINFNQWQTSSRTTKLLCTMVAKNFFFNFFFLIAIPVFSHTAFYGTFRSAAFSITISFFLPFSGDATGLRGTFPGHPRPFHLTFTDIHNNIYTPMGAFSRRDSNPCWPRGGGRKSVDSSFHHPTVSPW